MIKGSQHRISSGNIERIINKYADSIRSEFPNLPDKVYPHMFRRTRATNLYQSGVALELVSRILGHSSTETTKIYATPSIEMLRKSNGIRQWVHTRRKTHMARGRGCHGKDVRAEVKQSRNPPLFLNGHCSSSCPSKDEDFLKMRIRLEILI